MNIFILDTDFRKNVQMYVDNHVVKMPLESAQMLCTAVNDAYGMQIAPYKSTHQNHPCTLWVKQSRQNFNYLWNLMHYIDGERMQRFNRTEEHMSVRQLQEYKLWKYAHLFPDIGLTDFAQCMPEQYKVPGDACKAYQNYYMYEKQHIWKWTGRPMPDFIKNTLNNELIII